MLIVKAEILCINMVLNWIVNVIKIVLVLPLNRQYLLSMYSDNDISLLFPQKEMCLKNIHMLESVQRRVTKFTTLPV